MIKRFADSSDSDMESPFMKRQKLNNPRRFNNGVDPIKMVKISSTNPPSVNYNPFYNNNNNSSIITDAASTDISSISTMEISDMDVLNSSAMNVEGEDLRSHHVKDSSDDSPMIVDAENNNSNSNHQQLRQSATGKTLSTLLQTSLSFHENGFDATTPKNHQPQQMFGAASTPPSSISMFKRGDFFADTTSSMVLSTSNNNGNSVAPPPLIQRKTLYDNSEFDLSTASSAPHPGTMTRFDYEFQQLGTLGSGSFGKVYKVQRRLDGCNYAVKVIDQPVSGPSSREKLLKEIYALSACVENPHVVRYFSSWIENSKLYIQTELCDTSLEHTMKTGGFEKFGASLEDAAVEILRQLLLGLKLLHANNVVHLDIKPGNILIKGGVFKLGDLGHASIARKMKDNSLPLPPPRQGAKDNAVQVKTINLIIQDVEEGDSRYLPLELLNEDYSHLSKADIFSLAASCYEIFLKGQALPANGDGWLNLRRGIFDNDATASMTVFLKQLLHMMMSPDPTKRPNADSLLDTGGPGGILLTEEDWEKKRLQKEVETLRHFVGQGEEVPQSYYLTKDHGKKLLRSNTM